ncbi:MAG: hypothetical protein RBS86_03095 [Candidatus Moranbacteria bacterium]|jgi:hypothetical protein|nr:hypothetical protein [Candidatus Moranbacteria bacterium]
MEIKKFKKNGLNVIKIYGTMAGKLRYPITLTDTQGAIIIDIEKPELLSIKGYRIVKEENISSR